MDKIKTTTGRLVEGEVQLIISDPYKYEGKQAKLQVGEIESIFRNSAKLLKEGGHIFLKTTLEHASSIIAAFKSEKGDAEQEIFTVDEAAYNVMGSPEDQRGRAGNDGPTTNSITVMYVHAMKLGTPSV